MKIKLLVLLSFLFVTPTAGCSSAYWLGTEDVNDSITVKKSSLGASLKVQTRKDTTHKLDVESVTWNADTKAFELKNLHSDYNGLASGVIAADASRALAVGQAQLSQAAYVDSLGRFVDSLGNAVKSGLLSYGEARAMALRAGGAGNSPLDGGASLNLPGGGGVTVGPRPTPPTTSQPSN